MNNQFLRKISYWPLFLVVIFGVILSFLAFKYLSDFEQRALKQAFVLDAQNRVGAIKRNFENVMDAVRILGRFYDSSEFVHRGEFKLFARELIKEKEGIQYLQWVPRVSAADRLSYEQNAKVDGLLDFHIYQKGDTSLQLSDSLDHEYYPVFYIEPLKGNEEVLGKDYSIEAQRAATLYLARDSNLMIISPSIPLSKETQTNEYAFMLAKAVYRHGFIDRGIDSRRENLNGFVTGLLRLSEIADKALGYVKGKEMTVLIYDQFAMPGNQLIYEYKSEPTAHDSRTLMEGHLAKAYPIYYSQAINMLNTQWIVVCLPTRAYLSSGRTWLPLAGAGIVAIITLSLFLYLWITIRRSVYIEREVKRATADLQKVNQELESFAFTASHDMKAPLRGVASFAGFLYNEYKDKLDDKGRSYLQEIMLSTVRLRDLIEGLLSLAKVSQVKDQYQKVDVGGILAYVRQALTADISRYQVDLQIAENLPTVYAVPVKLQIVFLNLISNAIKFSSKNASQGVRVEVGFTQTNKEYQFFVKDNGIGISPQDYGKIFGYFNRLNKSSEYEGNGIGLSIVQKAVEDHGGRVWVESQLGHGAVFFFTLPKRRD